MITIKRAPAFDAWFESIKDGLTKRRLVARLRKVQLGNFGDVRALGQGVFEMREHFGPGWRIYYHRRGEALIVLLSGGSKATQVADIEKAFKIAEDLED